MKQKSVKDIKSYPFKDPFDGDFRCHNKQLTSLEGCPKVVKGNFFCSYNNLKSLQYCPQIIEGYFDCDRNNLQSLQYCPQIVEGNFYCHYNKLESLQTIHKYCKQIDGALWAYNNPIISHVLGVMLIDNIMGVGFDQQQARKIINTHLETDRDVYLCQDDLIKTGFVEYAQL
jgi:hypothetical protein